MKKTLLITFLMGMGAMALAQPAGRQLWNKDWTFTKDGTSRVLTLPHDWGVEQPFQQENPGETGKLAWWGKATYSKTLQVEDLSKDLRLEVDGAFSNAKVFVNGHEAALVPRRRHLPQRLAHRHGKDDRGPLGQLCHHRGGGQQGPGHPQTQNKGGQAAAGYSVHRHFI